MKASERNGENGFTLMELLAVLALLALVVVISLPLLKSSGGARAFRAEAQEIAALFRLARVDAVTRDMETRIVVDLKRRRISYQGRANAVELGADTAIEVKTAKGETVAETASFLFTPGGGATGGALFLKRQGHEATIAVSWLTGAVRIAYDGSQR
ncbi:MAG: GspH/FimT family pseudopilin [Parvibaculaceae bacterium]